MDKRKLNSILKFSRVFQQGSLSAFISLCWLSQEHDCITLRDVALVMLDSTEGDVSAKSNINRTAKSLFENGYLVPINKGKRIGSIALSQLGLDTGGAMGFTFGNRPVAILSKEQRLRHLMRFSELFSQSKFGTFVATDCAITIAGGSSRITDISHVIGQYRPSSKSLVSNTSRSLEALYREGYVTKKRISAINTEVTLTSKGLSLSKALGLL